MTSVPDGNYLLMVWLVNNGTKVQYAGTLDSILTIPKPGEYYISVEFKVPKLNDPNELFFTLDLYENPTKRELVCIQVTSQIGQVNELPQLHFNKMGIN
jgi:hypothetical protein